MPGPGAGTIRNMSTYLPDTVRGPHQPQSPVIAEVGYEELIAVRMRNHLMRVRRKLPILVWAGTAKRKLRPRLRNVRW